MAKTIWEIKRDILQAQQEKEYINALPMINQNFHFYHYTSLEVLFNILDGDAFWASNVRFSNDSMEEKMVDLDTLYKRDDYIICFCSESDVLSQWRGYCYNGGGAIKLDLRSPNNYSVLHADYDEKGHYQIYKNAPLPVTYVDPKVRTGEREKTLKDIINHKKGEANIQMEDIVPYLKNGKFYEEKELRLVFSNIGGNLSKCIRFKTLQNGAKVPYIVVKHGDIGKMNGNCILDMTQFTDDNLYQHMRIKKPIYIPEGTDQESKYYEVMARIKQYETEHPDELLMPFRVFCNGHLPIEEITVAPTYDSDRIAEQIERFCMSKYWLRCVKVKKSEIPYIKPMV